MRLYRFKKQHNNVVFWLDVVDDHQSVPLFESRVVAKVVNLILRVYIVEKSYT
jgi:hypothetical protein